MQDMFPEDVEHPDVCCICLAAKVLNVKPALVELMINGIEYWEEILMKAKKESSSVFSTEDQASSLGVKLGKICGYLHLRGAATGFDSGNEAATKLAVKVGRKVRKVFGYTT